MSDRLKLKINPDIHASTHTHMYVNQLSLQIVNTSFQIFCLYWKELQLQCHI